MSSKKNLFLQSKHSLSLKPKSKSLNKISSKNKKYSKVEIIKGPWSIEEDKKLKEYIEKNGPKNWTKCALNIPGRTGKQCREHWNNSLNDSIKKGNWSSEEDYLIMVFYEKYHGSWKKMIPIFRSRTENSIKNRFFSQIRKIASRYIKTGKREYSTKFGLNILLKYYKMGLEEAKNEFLKDRSMNEKELEEYINNIDNMVNQKPKEEKFIDIKILRKDENNINDNIIDIKEEKNENKTTEGKKYLNKEEQKGKIEKNKDIKKDNLNTEEELKSCNKAINIIINQDEKEIPNNIKEDVKEIPKKILDKNSKLEVKNKELNKPEINKNQNLVNNINKSNGKTNISNNGIQNINYSINNTITYNINNNFNNNNMNNNNNNNNIFNNINYNMNNMNNYINNPNESVNQNLSTNQNSINNSSIFYPLTLKNNNFYSGSNSNLNTYKNMNYFSKKSSDFSELILNNEHDQVENNQKQNEIATTPHEVFNLLNSCGGPDIFPDNNYKYIKINSRIIENPNYSNNNHTNYQYQNSKTINNFDDKNVISPLTPNIDRRFIFPRDQINNYGFNRLDSYDNNKGAFSAQNFYGFNRLTSFSSVKDFKS